MLLDLDYNLWRVIEFYGSQGIDITSFQILTSEADMISNFMVSNRKFKNLEIVPQRLAKFWSWLKLMCKEKEVLRGKLFLYAPII